MKASQIALYELKRQSFLIGYIQKPRCFDEALAYAYHHRLAPVFHENIARQTYDGDPFEEVYAVKRAFILEVLEYLDERARAQDYEAIQFYALEDRFGGYRTNREELKHALEYARIAGRFDDKVWGAVESHAPAECDSLVATFSPDEVHFD